jgi:hypothetical protein
MTFYYRIRITHPTCVLFFCEDSALEGSLAFFLTYAQLRWEVYTVFIPDPSPKPKRVTSGYAITMMIKPYTHEDRNISMRQTRIQRSMTKITEGGF